jgi:hypothetical protein
VASRRPSGANATALTPVGCLVAMDQVGDSPSVAAGSADQTNKVKTKANTRPAGSTLKSDSRTRQRAPEYELVTSPEADREYPNDEFLDIETLPSRERTMLAIHLYCRPAAIVDCIPSKKSKLLVMASLHGFQAGGALDPYHEMNHKPEIPSAIP